MGNKKCFASSLSRSVESLYLVRLSASQRVNIRCSIRILQLTFLSLDLILEALVEDPVDIVELDVVRVVLGPAGVIGQAVDQRSDVVALQKTVLGMETPH